MWSLPRRSLEERGFEVCSSESHPSTEPRVTGRILFGRSCSLTKQIEKHHKHIGKPKRPSVLDVVPDKTRHVLVEKPRQNGTRGVAQIERLVVMDLNCLDGVRFLRNIQKT